MAELMDDINFPITRTDKKLHTKGHFSLLPLRDRGRELTVIKDKGGETYDCRGSTIKIHYLSILGVGALWRNQVAVPSCWVFRALW